MEHNHSHRNIIFIIFEALLGFLSNSMALVADALVSLGVVVAGIVIMLTGITWVDSAVSFIIIAVILYSSYNLLLDSVNLALDAVPENFNLQSVKQYLESVPEVLDVHDLHIWALSTTDAALTVHLSTRIQTDTAFITIIQRQLHEQFGIEHSTIQVEYGNQIASGENICN